MTERREAPPGRKESDDADHHIDHPVAIGAAPSPSRHAREERGARDEGEDPDVASDLGEVVVGEESRLPERTVPAQEIGCEEQRRPAHRERPRTEEAVVHLGAFGEVDEGPARQELDETEPTPQAKPTASVAR